MKLTLCFWLPEFSVGFADQTVPILSEQLYLYPPAGYSAETLHFCRPNLLQNSQVSLTSPRHGTLLVRPRTNAIMNSWSLQSSGEHKRQRRWPLYAGQFAVSFQMSELARQAHIALQIRTQGEKKRKKDQRHFCAWFPIRSVLAPNAGGAHAAGTIPSPGLHSVPDPRLNSCSIAHAHAGTVFPSVAIRSISG